MEVAHFFVFVQGDRDSLTARYSAGPVGSRDDHQDVTILDRRSGPDTANQGASGGNPGQRRILHVSGRDWNQDYTQVGVLMDLRRNSFCTEHFLDLPWYTAKNKMKTPVVC